MPEAEDILIKAAQLGFEWTVSLFAKTVQHRTLRSREREIELFLAAAAGIQAGVYTSDRAAGIRHKGLWGGGARAPLPSTNGSDIWLPPDYLTQSGPGYEYVALCQAFRILRGTARVLPSLGSKQAHDLFYLSEGAAVDATLSSMFPGLLSQLLELRAQALSARPRLSSLSKPDRDIEALLQSVLSRNPRSRSSLAAPGNSVQAAALWAQNASCATGRYRGLEPVAYWGEIRHEGKAQNIAAGLSMHDAGKSSRSARVRRPRVREADPQAQQNADSLWMVPHDDPHEAAQDPLGLSRPLDKGEASADELGDMLSEMPEALLVRTPGKSGEVLWTDDRLPESVWHLPPAANTFRFHEWDYRHSVYRVDSVRVHESLASAGPALWISKVRRSRAAEIAHVRKFFHQLRFGRMPISRQSDGDEIDVEAFVRHHAELTAGRGGETQLFRGNQKTRPPIAVFILVDISASTDSPIGIDTRAIDVEKESLLVLNEALMVVGDPYAIAAYSGQGPGGVQVSWVKSFASLRDARHVAHRISGIEPDSYTRTGAALRFASEALSGIAAERRLLLLLSDGKPNDEDVYEGKYGIEDTRMAVREIRQRKIEVFCLAMERRAPACMEHIFGPHGYGLVQRPGDLSSVMCRLLRKLMLG